ncbi:MAG TPA: response regulator [Nitrospirota bacterium]|nr:response regulator [Nitrospirota bacterium]
MQRVLVVDDEPDIIRLITYNLKKEGFSVISASDGEEALHLIGKGGIALVILDLMLPGISGLEVCLLVRRGSRIRHLPIIMLTAKGGEHDRVRGLESGADDYLAKPFSPRELIARVRAVLRRTGERPHQEEIIKLGDLTIRKETFDVRKKGKPVVLSATEFRLLLYLAERKGRVFSREQLLDAVWNDESFVEPRTVDVHIRRLRMEIEDDPSDPAYVKTRRGVGYYAEGELL